ncbi:hypothetical protein J6590_016790, partial [Homalodisca vitripennis]
MSNKSFNGPETCAERREGVEANSLFVGLFTHVRDELTEDKEPFFTDRLCVRSIVNTAHAGAFK